MQTSNMVVIDLCPHVAVAPEELFGSTPNSLPSEKELVEELERISATKGLNDFYRNTKVPCVFAYLREYVEEDPNRFVYNSDIVNLVKSKVKVPVKLLTALDSAVYLAQRELEPLKKAAIIRAFVADGFVLFADFQPADKLRVTARIQNPSTSSYHFSTVEGRMAKAGDGSWYMLPKGARNRGYQLSHKEVYVKVKDERSKK